MITHILSLFLLTIQLCSTMKITKQNPSIDRPVGKYSKKLPYVTQKTIRDFLEIKLEKDDVKEWCQNTRNKIKKNWCMNTVFFEMTENLKREEFDFDDQKRKVSANQVVDHVVTTGGFIPVVGTFFLSGRLYHANNQIAGLTRGQIEILQFLQDQQERKTKHQRISALVDCLYRVEIEKTLCPELMTQILFNNDTLSASEIINTLHYAKGETISISKHSKTSNLAEIEIGIIDSKEVIQYSKTDTLLIEKSHQNTFVLTKKPALFLDLQSNRTLTLHQSDFSISRVLVDYSTEFDSSSALHHDMTICSNGINDHQIFRMKPSKVEVNYQSVMVHGLANFDKKTRIRANGKICQHEEKTIHTMYEAHFSSSLQEIFEHVNHTLTEPQSIADIIGRVKSGLGGVAEWISGGLLHLFHQLTFMVYGFLFCGLCFVVCKCMRKCGMENSVIQSSFMLRKVQSFADQWESNDRDYIKQTNSKVANIHQRQVQNELIIKTTGSRLDRLEKENYHLKKTIAGLLKANPMLKNASSSISSESQNTISNNPTAPNLEEVDDGPPKYRMYDLI